MNDVVLDGLASMPDELERALRALPAERLRWKPESWGGCPGETFSALEHACHLRDIETEGYQVRFRRLLDEHQPSLVSLDGYALAEEKRYAEEDLGRVLQSFRAARAATLELLRGLGEAQLDRAGDFAEYGRLTLRALAHYLRSHDQQHLACVQWLAGRMACEGRGA
jgi:hypothetical protein